MWFASAFAPVLGTACILDAAGITASGAVFVPGAVPEPAIVTLLGLGLGAIGWRRRVRHPGRTR